MVLSLLAGRVVPRMILVAAAGRVSHEILDRAQLELGAANISVVGGILNMQERIIPKWLYRWLTR